MKTAEQYHGLFNLMPKEHRLSLTISEMDEIIKEAQKVAIFENNIQANGFTKDCDCEESQRAHFVDGSEECSICGKEY